MFWVLTENLSGMFISTRNTPNISILQRIYYEYYDEKYLHHSISPNFRAPIICKPPLSLSPLWSIIQTLLEWSESDPST